MNSTTTTMALVIITITILVLLYSSIYLPGIQRACILRGLQLR